MIKFILNDKEVQTNEPGGLTLLDFVRYHKRLTGTKIGCREGDCGACTVLIGVLKDGQIKYQSMTSCITPLANVQNKHVVTIEGLNLDELSPVQQTIVDAGGTQCGFCTPGFIVSLTGGCIESGVEVATAIDGNICRCTGYKSIERAASKVSELISSKKDKNPIEWLISNKFIPEYFSTIPARLTTLNQENIPTNGTISEYNIVGGGTDLYVQRPEEMVSGQVRNFYDEPQLKKIELTGDDCYVGASATVTDLLTSQIFRAIFPNLDQHLKLVSSTPIRNMATLAGNFVNASPIGDMTIFFLALDSTLIIGKKGSTKRNVKLKDFYLDYKKLDLQVDEFVEALVFKKPNDHTYFNFEKVSKRTYLDIASVNTAISLKLEENLIVEVHSSAGGVGPVPTYLSKTCEFLTGKVLDESNIESAVELLIEDITPISDIRGSMEYKSLLLRQLFIAHFMELFPNQLDMEVLV